MNKETKYFNEFQVYLERLKDLIEVKPENQEKVHEEYFIFINRIRKIDGKDPIDYKNLKEKRDNFKTFKKSEIIVTKKS
jgi:hypothetical protein